MPRSSFAPHSRRPGAGFTILLLAIPLAFTSVPASARSGAGLHLPLDPCPPLPTTCLGANGPGAMPSLHERASATGLAGGVLTVTVPDATVLRRFTPRNLDLGGIVTPRSLLLAVAGRLGLPASRARGWSRRTVLLVDGKRWRPGGLFGYTKTAVTRGWIRRIDVVEEPPSSPSAKPSSGEASGGSDPPPPRADAGPSVVDVLLRNIRVSGAASIAAGVVEGSGPGSGGNAENYNLLLDIHDRRGDALVLDFDYLRSTVPFFPYAYGYGGFPPP